MADMSQMNELFTQLKFDKIIICANGNYNEIESAKKKLEQDYRKANNTEDGSYRVLFFVYYSGHGVMQNYT